ncbi:MAG: formylmethanofuran dehydrogenase subunit C [Candidatus Pacebacteria bacterium]|nr:formylmethanofuran dehydrogenase subunit C [Candidatus Paceibacterota bacterium]
MTRLVLKNPLQFRLSMAGILPQNLGSQTLSEIEKIPLLYGNRRSPLGEFFTVSKTSGSEDGLEIIGDGSRMDEVAAGMIGGTVTIEGNLGHSVAAAMTGGVVTVMGSVGHGAGHGMKGGGLIISGDAGDGLGSDLNEGHGPMTGGVIRVAGKVGDQAAHRLNRGVILVGGSLGKGAATRMNGGTVVALGKIDSGLGVMSQRGTILALGGVQSLLPSFADCGNHDLVIHRLLGQGLRQIGAEDFAARLASSESLHRYLGDCAVAGMSEIWL